MNLIRVYRWTLRKLHTALTTAQAARKREIIRCLEAQEALESKRQALQAEAVALEVQAKELSKLIG